MLEKERGAAQADLALKIANLGRNRLLLIRHVRKPTAQAPPPTSICCGISHRNLTKCRGFGCTPGDGAASLLSRGAEVPATVPGVRAATPARAASDRARSARRKFDGGAPPHGHRP